MKCSVMVTQVILVHLFQVQILALQLKQTLNIMVTNFLNRNSSVNILSHKVTTNGVILSCEYRFSYFDVEIYKNNNTIYVFYLKDSIILDTVWNYCIATYLIQFFQYHLFYSYNNFFTLNIYFNTYPQNIRKIIYNYIAKNKKDDKYYITKNYIYNIENNIVLPYDIISHSDIDDLKIKYPKSKYSPFVRYYHDKMPAIGYPLLIKEDLVYSEFGITQEKSANIINDYFIFKTPVCTNKNCIAGCLGIPKKFYNNNLRWIKYLLNNVGFLTSTCTLYTKIIVKSADDIINANYAYSIINDTICSYYFYKTNKEFNIQALNKYIIEFNRLRANNNFVDYYTMCRSLNIPIESPFKLKTDKQIQKVHDEALLLYSKESSQVSQEKEDEYKFIKQRYRDLSYKDNDFTIIYPNTLFDVKLEGLILHHCVGSYVDRILDMTAYIMFIRKNEDINTPYFTLHYVLENNKIVIKQVHGKYNCNTSDKILNFVKSWANKFEAKLEDINKCI